MNALFNTNYKMYSSVNEKGQKIQDFCEKYVYVLMDEQSLRKTIQDIRNEAEKLDNEYKRSKPLTVLENESRSPHSTDNVSIRVCIYPEGCADKVILWMDFVKVRKSIHYQTEINFENLLEKGSKE